MEDMQALAITSLSAADVAKQYEHIRELGKGTYGKVDLVAHRTQGQWEKTAFLQLFFCLVIVLCVCGIGDTTLRLGCLEVPYEAKSTLEFSNNFGFVVEILI